MAMDREVAPAAVMKIGNSVKGNLKFLNSEKSTDGGASVKQAVGMQCAAADIRYIGQLGRLCATCG